MMRCWLIALAVTGGLSACSPADMQLPAKDAAGTQTQADNPDSLRRRAYALIEAGKPQEAVGVFDQWIALAPEDAGAYNGKAQAFDRAGNHVAAQEIYLQALRYAPGSLGIQSNLAMSMILNGQDKEAAQRLEALHRQAPENVMIQHNLALAYGLLGERKKALALLQDLPPEQAQENLRFYERYAQARKAVPGADQAAEP